MRILLVAAMIAAACGSREVERLPAPVGSAQPAPVKPSPLPRLVQLELGDAGGCVRSDDGRVFCWGDELVEQRHSHDVGTRQVPLGVAQQIVVAGNSACARLADATVHCWGGNQHGVLGTGSRDPRRGPAPVPGVTSATGLFEAGNVVCATVAAGGFTCWGEIGANGLWDPAVWGTGALERSPRPPTKISGVKDVVQVDRTCVRHADESVTCWDDKLAPAKIADLTAIEIVANCARTDQGEAACWGSNQRCRLGLPLATRASAKPVAMEGVANVSQLFELETPCAVIANGSVWCQGSAIGGACKPRKLPNLERVMRVAGGCVLYTNGTVACAPSFQLSEAALAKAAPVAVPKLANVVEIVTRDGVACALTKDGSAWCWGKSVDAYGKTVERTEPERLEIDLATGAGPSAK